jgi:hypothetical protein
MNCPGCHSSDWESLDNAIVRCKNCGYLLDPNAFGIKKASSNKNLQRSANSKRWAKVVFIASLIIFIVSLWISDWVAFGVFGITVSLVIFFDHLNVQLKGFIAHHEKELA